MILIYFGGLMTKGKRIFNWICTAVTVAAIIIMAAKTDFSQFGTAISNINYSWLSIGMLAVVSSWLFDALVLKRLMPDITGKSQGILGSIKYALAYLYYFALSPFGSAGQPMQMMYMVNDGVSMGKTSAISGIKLFSDKVALAGIVMFFLAISGVAFFNDHSGMFLITIIAFMINLGILAGTFLIIIKPTLARRALHGGIKLLARLRIIKNPEKASAKADKAVDDYSSASVFMKNNKKKTLELILLSAVKRLLIFAVPYFLYRAFGLFEYGFISILALNIFMSLAISLMPTPGATVAAEGGFSMIFAGMFGAAIVPAVVIWRLMTHYMVIAAGSVMVITDNVSKTMRLKRVKKQVTIKGLEDRRLPNVI